MSGMMASSSLVQAIEQSGGYLPRFVRQEFEDYLKCGLLEHGFLRVKCDGCRHEYLVAFSCKRRGFCPSCGARRMVESVAHLVDHVFPEAPVRQRRLRRHGGLRAEPAMEGVRFRRRRRSAPGMPIARARSLADVPSARVGGNSGSSHASRIRR